MRQQQVERQRHETETEAEYAEWLMSVWAESVHDRADAVTSDASAVLARIDEELKGSDHD